MVKKLNKAVKSFKLGNKGFSLVELIVAVAILAVIVMPVLHSLVTATNISAKSQKLSQATDVANNVFEALDSSSITLFSECNENIKNALGATSFTKLERTDDQAEKEERFLLENVPLGSAKYDAKVTITPGEEGNEVTGGIFELNNKDIARYVDADGTFAQPYENSSNPDYSDGKDSDIWYKFYLASGVRTPESKQRQITIDVSQNGSKVYAYITYNYLFTYKGRYDIEKTVVSKKYAIFPNGVDVHSDGSPVVAYIMYYPFYENDISDRAKTPGGVTIDFSSGDTFEINNRDDINIQFYLVKQNPLVLVDGEYKKMNEDELRLKELYYTANIKENRSNEYDKGYQKQLYTNAGYSLIDNTKLSKELIYNISYKGLQMYGENEGKNILPDLVTTKKVDRIYYVQIDIYSPGTSGDEDAKPIYTLAGSAMA